MKAKKEKKQSGFALPLGGAFDVMKGVGRLFSSVLSIESKVEEIKEEATHKVEEIKAEAVRTAYAIKKAILRTVVESILLTTGILSLIAGLILLLKKIIPIEYILIGYGLLVTLFVALTVKLTPDNE